jgi:hypothetical protein
MPIREIALLFNDADTARALVISSERLESLVSAGDLVPIYIHSKRRFLYSDVQALVGAGKIAPAS